jgi:hypothetical protein
MRRHTITAGNFHLPERHIRRNYFSATRAVELATPVSFGNLGPLEFGDGSGDLVHQLRQRIVCRTASRKIVFTPNRSNSSRIKACNTNLRASRSVQ